MKHEFATVPENGLQGMIRRKIFNPSVPKEWGGSVNGEAIAGGDIFGVQSF